MGILLENNSLNDNDYATGCGQCQMQGGISRKHRLLLSHILMIELFHFRVSTSWFYLQGWMGWSIYLELLTICPSGWRLLFFPITKGKASQCSSSGISFLGLVLRKIISDGGYDFEIGYFKPFFKSIIEIIEWKLLIIYRLVSRLQSLIGR